MKRISAFILVMMLALSAFPVYLMAEEEGGAGTFSDVSREHWAYSAIEKAVEKGYVSGFPDGTFRPNEPVTVAQFLTMMFLSMVEMDEELGKLVFSKETLAKVPDHAQRPFRAGWYDFTPGTPWYANYVEIAQNFGFVRDQYDGRYNDPLPREEVAYLAYSMSGWFDGGMDRKHAMMALDLIKDRDDVYHELAVGQAMTRGLLSGYPDGTFKPRQFVTRAEAISVIERINNSNLRKPAPIDLSNVPHAIVPNYGYPDQVQIFADWKMKRVYDAMIEVLDEYEGATHPANAGIAYFEDDDALQEGLIRKHYRLGLDPGHVFDLSIWFSTNPDKYSMIISGVDGRYERATAVIQRLLGHIFPDQWEIVWSEIDETMTKMRNHEGRQIEAELDGRVYFIRPAPDMDMLHVDIDA